MAFDIVQSVEIVTANNSREFFFTFEMRCTNSSYPGHFDPVSGSAEPPSGAEYEVESVRIDVPKVNYKGEITGHEPDLRLTWIQFEAIVGRDVANELFENACDEADVRGDM